MRRLRAAAILLSAMVVASACGSDHTSAPVTATATAVPSVAASPRPIPTSSDARLDAALLTTDDLGAGWARQTLEGATVASGDYCGTHVDSVRTDGVAYLLNDAAEAYVIEIAQRSADEVEARRVFGAQEAAQRNCAHWTIGDGQSMTEWEGHTVDDAPAAGDQSFASAATSVGDPRLEMYGVITRYGRYVVGTLYVSFGASLDLAAARAATAAADARFQTATR